MKNSACVYSVRAGCFFHSFDADIHFVSHTHLVEADNYKTDKKSDKRINSDHETTQQKVRTNVNGYFPTVEYNSVFPMTRT